MGSIDKAAVNRDPVSNKIEGEDCRSRLSSKVSRHAPAYTYMHSHHPHINLITFW